MADDEGNIAESDFGPLEAAIQKLIEVEHPEMVLTGFVLEIQAEDLNDADHHTWTRQIVPVTQSFALTIGLAKVMQMTIQDIWNDIE